MSINVQWKMRKKSVRNVRTLALVMLSFCCFLDEFTVASGNYADADDMVNELDRPSEYITPREIERKPFNISVISELISRH
jgi:hypothetical protein